MRLTPPRIPVFLISVVLIGLAIVDMYWRIPSLHAFIAAHRFAMVVAAWIVLAIGVILPGL